MCTTDPGYYRWTQWIFLQLFRRGLAYQAEVPVNWCPALGTVLANEEVIEGRSERGGHPVVRLPMKQARPRRPTVPGVLHGCGCPACSRRPTGACLHARHGLVRSLWLRRACSETLRLPPAHSVRARGNRFVNKAGAGGRGKRGSPLRACPAARRPGLRRSASG